MAVFLILAGIILMFLSLRLGGAPAVFQAKLAGTPEVVGIPRPLETSLAPSEPPVDAGEEASLREEIATLSDDLAELSIRLRVLEVQGISKVASPWLKKEGSFGDALKQEDLSTLYQEIYRAADEGKDLAELARQFNRGKGEIELILNLRR